MSLKVGFKCISFLQIRKHQKYIDVSTGAKNSLAKFGFGLIKL